MFGGQTSAGNIRGITDGVYESFNRRFWNATTGYLFDMCDTEEGADDPAAMSACGTRRIIRAPFGAGSLGRSMMHGLTRATGY